MSRFTVCSLEDVLSAYGEARTGIILSAFTCPKNAEVESFIRDKAIQSAKLETSVSYLVFEAGVLQPVAYFTLTLKPVEIPASKLTAKATRMVKRFARLNAGRGSYTIAAYLIAQLGRNFAVEEEKRIDGRDLMNLILDQIRNAKKHVGGKIAFLECEKDRPALKKFYEDNKFVSWSERTDPGDKISYEQMFTVVERSVS